MQMSSFTSIMLANVCPQHPKIIQLPVLKSPSSLSFSQLRVWKCLADTQKLFGLKDECAKSLEKVTELQCQFGVEDDSDDERGIGSDDDDNDDEVTEALIEREMLLSDSGEWGCSYSKHVCYKMCGVSNFLKLH